MDEDIDNIYVSILFVFFLIYETNSTQYTQRIYVQPMQLAHRQLQGRATGCRAVKVTIEQNRTLLPQAKYLWQAARIANMAIYAGCP